MTCYRMCSITDNGKTQVIEIDGYHFTIVEVHTTTA